MMKRPVWKNIVFFGIKDEMMVTIPESFNLHQSKAE